MPVCGTPLHEFLLRFRLGRLSSTTSGGSSADTEDWGAPCWLREWRSIQTQNPKKTAVIASTAIVAGSIVFSSCLDSLLSDFLLRDSSWVQSRAFPGGSFTIKYQPASKTHASYQTRDFVRTHRSVVRIRTSTFMSFSPLLLSFVIRLSFDSDN